MYQFRCKKCGEIVNSKNKEFIQQLRREHQFTVSPIQKTKMCPMVQSKLTGLTMRPSLAALIGKEDR